MKFLMSRLFPAVLLVTAPVAHAQTKTDKVVVEAAPPAAAPVQALGAKDQELVELRKQVDELKLAVVGLQEELNRVPRASLDAPSGD